MKICMMSSPRKNVVDEIKFAGESGFHGIELAFEQPKLTPDQALNSSKQILDSLSSYKLIRIAHVQTFVNICDLYEGIRKAVVTEVVKAMNAARSLGVGLLTIHPGFLTPMTGRETAFEKSVESIGELLKVAEELDLTIGVENMPSGFPPMRGYFSRVNEFKELFSRLSSSKLRFVLDVAHTVFRDSSSSHDFINEFYGRTMHVHLSDNLGERDDHLPLGVGKVDYKGAVKELSGRGYSGTLTLEVFAEDRDFLLLSKRKVEELIA